MFYSTIVHIFAAELIFIEKSFDMTKIDKIIKEAINKVINEEIVVYREPLLEMAKLNMKDDGKSLFPSNAYNIIVQGDNSPNKPPHIHIISKQEGYNIKVLIETGELWQIVNLGRRRKTDSFSDVIKNIKEWLQQPSNVPMAKGDTNQVFAMGLWELNNP